ncbi:apoptosis regulator BAX [Xyrauchen texanus]|uniref:apoptosis regulator BAX n=1 Tax=Xyrauchen texanus TaxID=154827 RepID=UPI0022427C73|nr:apoptosis regulator BAX [Xyrauchen texanus]
MSSGTSNQEDSREVIMASDDLFSQNLVIRVLRDQVQRAGRLAHTIPELQPMNDEQEKLLEQMAEVIILYGDDLDRDVKFKNMVDGFARVADSQSFLMLVDKVFVDGITWGKIVMLICVVGKSLAKILADLVSVIVSWTLDYFKNKLLYWICNMGGWINSISSLAHYSYEQDSGSSTSLVSPFSGVVFISGLLLGGLIVWRLNRCA